jgi:hypothetical protein
MDNETLIRAGAVVAGIATLAGPWLVGVAKKIRVPSPAKATERIDVLKDAHTILEIASRLKEVKCDKGVALCQQLIDVMLQPSEPAK